MSLHHGDRQMGREIPLDDRKIELERAIEDFRKEVLAQDEPPSVVMTLINRGADVDEVSTRKVGTDFMAIAALAGALHVQIDGVMTKNQTIEDLLEMLEAVATWCSKTTDELLDGAAEQ